MWLRNPDYFYIVTITEHVGCFKGKPRLLVLLRLGELLVMIGLIIYNSMVQRNFEENFENFTLALTFLAVLCQFLAAMKYKIMLGKFYIDLIHVAGFEPLPTNFARPSSYNNNNYLPQSAEKENRSSSIKSSTEKENRSSSIKS